MTSMTPMGRRAAGTLLGAGLLLAAVAPAQADAERLEAELRALFAGEGAFEVERVSSALIRQRVTAEGLRFDAEEGERLRVDRYVVSGDYANPESVTLEGLRLEDGLTELPLMRIARVVLGEPGWAVPPREDEALAATRLGSLAVDELSLDLSSELLADLAGEAPVGEGRLTIERIRGEALSRAGIGRLELEGIAGVGRELDELGAGSFTLGRLLIEGLTGLDEEGAESLARFELESLALEAEELVASLASLRFDGDLTDGRGGLWLDALELDLAQMIALAPPEERTRMRMVSNVLTDGSGKLRLDAAFDAEWEERDGHTRLASDGRIEIADALRLGLGVELPLVLPEGVEPAALFADETLLEAATLLGGELRLSLADQGLFARLVTLGAALGGVTEAQYLEQARTQAQGFGMMFGPQVQAFLTGLVELMEGSAETLELAVTLPGESRLGSLAEDPLGLPDRLSIRVETR